MNFSPTIVVDTNVLINLFHINQDGLLGAFPDRKFVTSEHVCEEIKDSDQSKRLEECLKVGSLKLVKIEAPLTLLLFSELINIMGRGEASCLALASEHNWGVASDEKRRFRSEALRLLGNGKILTTGGLLLWAIQNEKISIEEADRAKEILAKNRFVLPFNSFSEIAILVSACGGAKTRYTQ